MKVKLDLSKFKLKDRNEKIATLINRDGHEIRLAISALHPNNRKNLDSLELHKEEKEASEPIKMAKGGEVPSKKEPTYVPGEGTKRQDDFDYMVSHFTPNMETQQAGFEAQQASLPTTPDDVPGALQPAPQLQSAAEPESQLAQQTAESPITPPEAAPLASSSSLAPAPLGAAQQAPNSQLQAIAGTQPGGPGFESKLMQVPGYAEQLAGIEKQRQAEAQLAQDKATAIKTNIAAEQQVLNDFESRRQDLQTEIDAVAKDIKEGHIDPNKYLGSMSTGQRITTGIGLFLGGLGAGIKGTGTNTALEFLNKQIDRDIEAQKANLDKKKTLYSMLREQGMDDRAATQMTSNILKNMAAQNVEMAAAKSGSQIAQARALQLSGALKHQVMGDVTKLAMTQMLAGAGAGDGQGGLSEQDPAKVAGIMVKAGHITPEQYKDVSKEIERAQNTKRVGDEIKSVFDQAVADTQGAGRVTANFKTPRSTQALKQLLGTTVTELTGSARQAEFDNVEKNLIPNQFDTAKDIEIKKKNLETYLRAKMSAPLAKGLGIDLEKYKSTAIGPEAQFSPRDKMMLELARKDPEHPRSKLIFKKLGIRE